MLLLKEFSSRHFLKSLPSFFATSKKRLSIEAERAVWATQVINSILNMKEPSEINNESFRQSLLNLSLSNQSFEFSEEAKQSVFKILDIREGADINTFLFKQNGIKNALQPSNNDKFPFSPSYLTTKKMFEQLVEFYQPNNKGSSVLVVGGSGIIKTTSIVLFITLALHQTNFFYKAQHKDTLKQQLRQLQQENLVTKLVPKYWYWQIDPSLAASTRIQQTFLQESLIAQATELEPEKIQELANFKGEFRDFTELLISYYPNNIISIPLIDRIDIIPSLLKQGKIEQQKLSRKSMGSQLKSQMSFNQQRYFLRYIVLSAALIKFRALGCCYFFSTTSDALLESQFPKDYNHIISNSTKIVELPKEQIFEKETDLQPIKELARQAQSNPQSYQLSKLPSKKPQKYRQFRSALSKFDRQMMIDLPSVRGQKFSYFFRNCIGEGTLFAIHCPKDGQSYMFKIFKTAQIELIQPFDQDAQHFPNLQMKRQKNRVPTYLLNNKFKNILNETGQKYTFAVPLYIMKQGQKRIAFKCKATDFLTIKYNQSSGKVKIFTFNTSITSFTRDHHALAKTLFTLLISDLKSLDLMELIEEINHTIICPSEACLPCQSISVDGTIIKFMYADRNWIQIEQYVSEYAYQGLKQTIMMLNLIDKKRNSGELEKQKDQK